MKTDKIAPPTYLAWESTLTALAFSSICSYWMQARYRSSKDGFSSTQISRGLFLNAKYRSYTFWRSAKVLSIWITSRSFNSTDGVIGAGSADRCMFEPTVSVCSAFRLRRLGALIGLDLGSSWHGVLAISHVEIRLESLS